MTCKIERLAVSEDTVVLRVSGRIRPEHVRTIERTIEREKIVAAFDLTEVMLVERDVVHFLASCEFKGIELNNCPGFLREWIDKEKLRMGRSLR